MKNKAYLDFNLMNISINESRLIGSEYEFDGIVKELLKEVTDINILKKAILSEYKEMIPNKCTEAFVEAYKSLIDEGFSFTTASLKLLLGDIGDEGRLIINKYHYKEIIALELITDPLSIIINSEGLLYKDITKENFDILESVNSLLDHNFCFEYLKENKIFMKIIICESKEIRYPVSIKGRGKNKEGDTPLEIMINLDRIDKSCISKVPYYVLSTLLTPEVLDNSYNGIHLYKSIK